MFTSLTAVVPTLALAAGWGTHSIRLRHQLAEAERAVAAARLDPVTCLPTRAAWTAQAHQMLADDSGATIVLIDLDEFKEINDTHGHAAGDAVLAVQAARIAAWCGGRGIAGRLGGDEFAAVVYPVPEFGADPIGITENLIALMHSLQAPISIEGQAPGEYEVLFNRGSIGAVVYDTLAEPSLSQALHGADTAMYQCKQLGTQPILSAAGQRFTIEPNPARRPRHHGPTTSGPHQAGVIA